MNKIIEYPLRVQSFIAKSTTLSRRKAESAIIEKRVEIESNGLLRLAVLGDKVEANDKVYLDKERLFISKKSVVYMLNKPKGVLCSDSDPFSMHLAKDYIHTADHDFLFSVGRLDKDSQGLILFTNDGDLANKIIHPSKKIEKVYTVKVDEKLSKAHFEKMQQGIEVLNEKTNQNELLKIKRFSIMTSHWVEVAIESGKNREIRRLFEHFNYTIKTLLRIKIGNLDIGDLKPGEYKKLNGDDIKKIFEGNNLQKITHIVNRTYQDL